MTDGFKNEHDKEQVLNEALNRVDERFVEEAASVRKTKRYRWIPAVAAAAVLLIAAVLGIPALTRNAGTGKLPLPAESPGKVREFGGVIIVEGPGYKPAGSSDGFYYKDSGKVMEADSVVTTAAPMAVERPASDESGELVAAPGTVVDGEAKPEGEAGDDKIIEEPVKPGDDFSEPDPGQITASAWSDNDHYPLFKTLFKTAEQGSTAGKFEYYANPANSWFKGLTNRIAVTVKNGDAPVPGQLVSLIRNADGTSVEYRAVTNANGTAYLFASSEEPYQILVGSGDGLHVIESADMEDPSQITVDISMEPRKDNVIEIMYVIDVTGSMSDELSYLKSELADVIRKVTEANPDAEIRLSFLCYRDDEDAEKFFYSDFKNVTDPAGMKEQLDLLKTQDAMGGGDYEEAVDDALEFAMARTWSETSTKLVFHVLDAPAHDLPEHRARYEQAVKTAAEKGIRLCPVLASGSDDQTEYLSRAEALLTGGTFIFITDDSGIGYGHHEPQLPDAVHEYLNALMIRLINGYYTGEFADPVAWNAG